MSKLPYIAMISFFTVSSGAAWGDKGYQACLGQPDAPLGVVYLHGLAESLPTAQESKIQSHLAKLSKELGLRVAFPRANGLCRKSQLCWQKSTLAQVKETLSYISKTTSGCLKKQKKLVAVGFSNGGWFLNKALRWCLETPFRKLISLGSAGSIRTEKRADYSTCGELVLMIGEKDRMNLKPAIDFYSQLKQRKAKVQLIRYPGGHDATYQALKTGLDAARKSP